MVIDFETFELIFVLQDSDDANFQDASDTFDGNQKAVNVSIIAFTLMLGAENLWPTKAFFEIFVVSRILCFLWAK